MRSTASTRILALAALAVVGAPVVVIAQTVTADPHHPDRMLSQAMPPSGMGRDPGAMPGQPGMMGRGMMGGMPTAGMHGHMMKIMFAIADVNGDGALSFEEVTAIHKRIFDRIDADKDGKMTLDELQAFMRE